jgi:ABC-type enterochelin transport system permease subunit
MGSIKSAGCRFFLGLLASSALISCASMSVTSPELTQYHTQVNFLPATVSASLQQAEIGQVVSLAQSPWGSAVSIELVGRYFSAAGRDCFSALVHATQPTTAVVLCQYEPQRWGFTRALTQTIAQ